MTRFATQTINGLLTLANILQVPTAELLVCLKRADAGGVLTRVEGSGLAAGDEGCHNGQNGGGLEHHFGVRGWDVSLDFEFEGIGKYVVVDSEEKRTEEGDNEPGIYTLVELSSCTIRYLSLATSSREVKASIHFRIISESPV